MAINTGTSTGTWQRVVGWGPLTAAQFELTIPALKLNNPTRIGYGFVMARDNAAPQPIRILRHDPIYAPGLFITFPANYGFSAYQYTWYINWNIPNLAWQIIYS